MVRMAAVAIIDVASGRIEALAGALSPCTRQEYDGPGARRACDQRMPYPIRYRPDALLNPAVFHDAMPASTIKPIMAAAFLSDPDVGQHAGSPPSARRCSADGDAVARQPARAARCARTPRASSTACSAPTKASRVRAAVGNQAATARVRLERRMRERRADGLRQARPAVRPSVDATATSGGPLALGAS